MILSARSSARSAERQLSLRRFELWRSFRDSADLEKTIGSQSPQAAAFAVVGLRLATTMTGRQAIEPAAKRALLDPSSPPCRIAPVDVRPT